MSEVGGSNWGQIVLDQNTLDFRDIKSNLLLQVPMNSIQNCVASKSDITVSLKSRNTTDAFIPTEIRFAIPPSSKVHDLPGEEGIKFLMHSIQSRISAQNEEGSTGETEIVRFDSVSFSAPSGMYNVQILAETIKIFEKKKGASFIIPLSNVQCMFLLPYPHGGKKYFCISLVAPLRIGQTSHFHLVLTFDDSAVISPDDPMKLSLTQDAINELYGPSPAVTASMAGPVVEIFAKVIKCVTKKKLFGQGEHRSAAGETCCMSTVFRSTNGFLYCLDKSFLLLHRPATFVRHDDISGIEIQGLETGNINRTFILILSTKKGEKLTFGSIDKIESSRFLEYLQRRNLNFTLDGLQVDEELNSDSDSDSSAASSASKKKRTHK